MASSDQVFFRNRDPLNSWSDCRRTRTWSGSENDPLSRWPSKIHCVECVRTIRMQRRETEWNKAVNVPLILGMSAFLKEAGQKSPVMTGMSIQGQETQSLWSDSIINVMCNQTHFFCSCGRWMDGVWERRERSLTEPQWDNEGRGDKAAWGSSKTGRGLHGWI